MDGDREPDLQHPVLGAPVDRAVELEPAGARVEPHDAGASCRASPSGRSKRELGAQRAVGDDRARPSRAGSPPASRGGTGRGPTRRSPSGGPRRARARCRARRSASRPVDRCTSERSAPSRAEHGARARGWRGGSRRPAPSPRPRSSSGATSPPIPHAGASATASPAAVSTTSRRADAERVEHGRPAGARQRGDRSVAHRVGRGDHRAEVALGARVHGADRRAGQDVVELAEQQRLPCARQLRRRPRGEAEPVGRGRQQLGVVQRALRRAGWRAWSAPGVV